MFLSLPPPSPEKVHFTSQNTAIHTTNVCVAMHTLTLFCPDKQCEVDFNCVYIIIQPVFIMRCFSLQNELLFCDGGARHCNIFAICRLDDPPFKSREGHEISCSAERPD
jgi:hypothetical protein